MNEVLAKIIEDDSPKSKEERKEQAVKLLISFCKELGMSGTDTARMLQRKFRFLLFLYSFWQLFWFYTGIFPEKKGFTVRWKRN